MSDDATVKLAGHLAHTLEQVALELARLRGRTAACDGDRQELLRELPAATIRSLYDHLPPIAGPWEITHMASGRVTRAVRRDMSGNTCAAVFRKCGVWVCKARGVVIDATFADIECAQNAVDAQLALTGLVLLGDHHDV